jgi:hypothetical protein
MHATRRGGVGYGSTMRQRVRVRGCRARHAAVRVVCPAGYSPLKPSQAYHPSVLALDVTHARTRAPRCTATSVIDASHTWGGAAFEPPVSSHGAGRACGAITTPRPQSLIHGPPSPSTQRPQQRTSASTNPRASCPRASGVIAAAVARAVRLAPSQRQLPAPRVVRGCGAPARAA